MVVINTASATLQQLIISIFERVVREDKNAEKVAPQKTFEVSVDNGEGGEGGNKILVSPVSYDALMIFIDLCNLTEKQKPVFLKKFNHLPETFGLELLESIMTNHSELFLKHIEFAYILRTRVVPLLLRAFSEKREFSVTVRVTRILYLLLRRQLSILKVEGEVILSLLTHMLDKDSAPYWKRLLCMEVFQGVCSEFSLVQEIYQEYDAKEGQRRAIIKGLTASFDKIINERRDLIGYGPVSMVFRLPFDESDEGGTGGSNIPTLHDNDAADYSNVVGISLKTSVARVPCIDLLDKGEPPVVPQTYLYYLVLLCINSLSEGLARRVLQTTATTTASVSSSTSQTSIATQFINQCWKELLSCYTTFFHATIDLDLYHSSVRSVQKLAHSAGFLELQQPRDAFLSLLGEFSISQLSSSSEHGRKGSTGNTSASTSTSSVATTATNMARNLLSVESIVGTLGSIREHQKPASSGLQSASVSPRPSSTGTTGGNSPSNPTARNILCFRALLNLAHTLGPSLSSSWDIILQTIQSFDTLINGSGKKRKRTVKGSQIFSQLGSELNPVDNSYKRLLDSTKEFPDDSFLDLLSSACRVSERILAIVPQPQSNDGNLLFALDLLGELGIINMNRLISPNNDKTWEKLTNHLLKVIDTRSIDPSARLHSSIVLNDLITKASIDVVTSTNDSNQAQRRVINTLKSEIDHVIKVQTDDSSILLTEADIHVSSIDTLNKVLDQCGGKFTNGWDLVFQIIDSVFESISRTSTSTAKQNDKTSKLVKSGFESLTLICNDFLIVLPEKCLMSLVDTLSKFCNQESDLNISFTSISFFWTVSDHLRNMIIDGNHDFEEPVADGEMLSDIAINGQFPLNIHSLWILSLLRLATTAGDPRTQVRNGSIQILFRILDANGNTLPIGVWKTVQAIVITSVMKVRPPSELLTNHELANSWVETMTLILNGFSNLFSSFILLFIKQDDFVQLWSKLVDYFQLLIKSDQNHLSLPVYNSLDGILTNLSKQETAKFPTQCLDKVWGFWTNQSIPTNPIDTKLTQESLTILAQLHQPLYELSKKNANCSFENLTKTINIFKQTATFSLLPQFYSDRDHMSPLQAKTLERIESIEITDYKIASLVLNLLSTFVILPFSQFDGTQLNDNAKRPTYIGLAAKSLKLLKEKFTNVSSSDYEKLCENQTIENIFSSLLLLMDKKFDCPLIQKSEQMWQSATQIFLYIFEQLQPISKSERIWKLSLKLGIAIISSSSSNSLQYETEYENFDIESYKRFITLVEENENTSDDFWIDLLQSLFQSSAIYYRGKYNQTYYQAHEPEESIKRLVKGPFYGSTERVTARSRPNLGNLCFNELFRLSSHPPKSSPLVVTKLSQYLTLRSSIILHQYISDQPIRGQTPIPKICRLELIQLLELIVKYDSQLTQLTPLITKSLSISFNDVEILTLLQNCIQHWHINA